MGLKEDRVHQWETAGQITLSRLERVAEKTYTPVGYLFLADPPDESLPISDFRTVGGDGVNRPSSNLLDTIYQCQQRQSWYRDFLIAEGELPLQFVGSASQADPASAVAGAIRHTLGLENGQSFDAVSWEAALGSFIERVEEVRILVMRNGVVGNNTHRKLDVAEFRGFALSDEYAPLVFINGADAKSAQMFTLAHEIAHLWLGESGVSDADPNSHQPSERFCNAVAAEVLIPLESFKAAWRGGAEPLEEARRLSRHFKVSTLVVLIRAREAGVISNTTFTSLYSAAALHTREAASGSGGDFYRTQGSRLGKRFARAVIVSALEGQTTYKEALQLLGFKKTTALDELAERLGLRA
jgi:Zn-dependent peptidase ImmA (M78 family)